MKLVKRRIILFFTIILFITLSIGLVFYAIGYRFNTNYNEVREVGIIDVANTPASAQIFIDGEKISNRTPHQIKDLYQGEYVIKTEKEGYTTWKKNIVVNAREVSWIRNARNFLLNPENKEVSSQSITHLLQSKDRGSIIFSYITGDTFTLKSLNPTNAEEKTVIQFDINKIKVLSLDISNDGKKILIEYIESGVHKWSILPNQENQKITELALNDKKISKIHFSHVNSDELFILEDTTLSKIDFEGNNKVYAKNTIDFDSNQSGLYYVTRNSNNVLTINFIKKSNFTFNQEEKAEITVIPSKEISNFKVNRFNDVAINTPNKGLLLFNNQNKRLIELGTDITQFSFGLNTRKLIFSSEQEVHFYEMAREKDEYLRQAYEANRINLLTRYSEKIKDIGFYADEAWVWISLEKGIKIVELDERSTRNTYDINNVPGSSVLQNKEGAMLYFTDKELNTLQSMHVFDK